MEFINLMHSVLLRKFGVEDRVLSFTNPEDALDHMRFQKTDSEPILVLLDINMPQMTGFEFLEFMVLENFPTNIDVIIVSSSLDYGDRILAENFPQYIKNFVSKPLKPEKLGEFFQEPLKKAL
jgi:CheY-like chemotaxis protein